MKTIKWNEYVIKKVELSEEIRRELFSGITSTSVEELPEVFKTAEEGYYLLEVEGLNQYFALDDSMIEYGGQRNINFPLFKGHVLYNYIQAKWERKYQEELGEVLAQVTVFDNDVDTELIWFDGIAKMKPYYDRTIEIKDVTNLYEDDGDGSKFYELLLNGKVNVDIYYNVENGYSCYDGVDGYGWHKTLKQAVKRYMDSCFIYKTDDVHHEVSCTSCGDGGCIHCRPSWFIK